MPALHIRDVPDETVAALKERAVRHGVSMQRELRRVLEEAAAEPVAVGDVLPLDLVAGTSAGGSTWGRDEIYDDDAR